MSRQKERDLVCKPFVNSLRNYERLGLCEEGLAWTHIVNEQMRWGKGNAYQQAILGAHLKAMGRRAGWPDYVFLWPAEHRGCARLLFLEAKAPDVSIRLTGEQLKFQKLCEKYRYPHHVFTSWGDGIKYLIDYGVIRADDL